MPEKVLPYALYSSDQVREMDRIAIQELGIAGFTLMTRAGEAAYDILEKNFPKARNICVVCGTGNNGGDGFVVAKLAQSYGYKVVVLLIGDENNIEGDALQAFENLDDSAVEIHAFAEKFIAAAEVIIDGIFGTGLARDVNGLQEEAIKIINASGKAVIALDVPSGLSADTGTPRGIAVKASCTVTFMALKCGLFTGEGPEHCGNIFYCDLGVNDGVRSRYSPTAQRITTDAMAPLVARRKRHAHKGDFGHVVIIGGNHGFLGAVLLAARAALKSGGGLVSVATRSEHAPLIAIHQPEIMAHKVEDKRALEILLSKATAVAIGPGLGQDAWAENLFASVLEKKLPVVIDADALNLLAKSSYLPPLSQVLLTPHPGEAARLLGVANGEINRDRFTALKKLCEKFQATTVLKGCGTLVSSHEAQEIFLCSDGNPGMAKAGSGDVLTGICAAFLAQGCSSLEAAKRAVCLHARAGDLAAQGCGESSMLASDIIENIGQVIHGSSPARG